MLLLCSRCKNKKQDKSFGLCSTTRNRMGKSYYCLECSRVIAREHRIKYKYREIFEKYKNKCAICKSIKNLEIHHKHKKSQELIDDLILVCRSCHLKIFHNGCWKRKTKGLVCCKCEHEWTPRKKEVRQCPSCKSAYWEKRKS